jgi:hypothetical protein
MITAEIGELYFGEIILAFIHLAHGIEQPNFPIPNPQYLQRNFVYLNFCLIKSRTNSQQRHL